jgi:hypothetical protein
MDVSYGIKLDSPLPVELSKIMQHNYKDVKVEDVMNAPSLSISLQTATDASAFLLE